MRVHEEGKLKEAHDIVHSYKSRRKMIVTNREDSSGMKVRCLGKQEDFDGSSASNVALFEIDVLEFDFAGFSGFGGGGWCGGEEGVAGDDSGREG